VLPSNNPCGASTNLHGQKQLGTRVALHICLTKDQKPYFERGAVFHISGNERWQGHDFECAPSMSVQQFTTAQTRLDSIPQQTLPLPTPPNLADPTKLNQIYFAFDTHMKLAQSFPVEAPIYNERSG